VEGGEKEEEGGAGMKMLVNGLGGGEGRVTGRGK